MHRIAIAGLSLFDTDLAVLERLARGALATDPRELADALGASELVLIETCNRLEIVFAREEGALPDPDDDLKTIALALAPRSTADGATDELARRMHFHVERDAARYLFRIAASLESLVVGEDQILAQVREAFTVAERSGLVGPLLTPLFRQALHTGKLVRSRTELSRHPVSIVSIAVHELERRARAAGREGLRGARVLLVGAGKMARLFVPALAAAGAEVVAVANRDLQRARALAVEIASTCTALALADLERSLPELKGRPIDTVVAATGSPGFVLGPGIIGRLADRLAPGRALFAADVAVPRDLDPGGDERVVLVDIEALRELAAANRAKRDSAAERAAALVEERVAVFLARSFDPLVADALADLHAQTADLVRHELEQLLGARGPLRALGPASTGSPGRTGDVGDAGARDALAAALERWARRLTAKLNHVASGRLKRLARELEDAPGEEELV